MVKRIPDIATYAILTRIVNNGRAVPSQIPSQISAHGRGGGSTVIPVMKVADFDVATRMVTGQYPHAPILSCSVMSLSIIAHHTLSYLLPHPSDPLFTPLINDIRQHLSVLSMFSKWLLSSARQR